MANLLAEQLLKAGLVDKDRAKAIEREKHQGKKKKAPKKTKAKNASNNKKSGKPPMSEEQKQKLAHDRALNELKKQKSEARAIQASIRQLVMNGREERTGGESDFQFVYGNKIRKMLVTEEMRERLLKGHLCIVNLDGQFEVVRREQALKVAAKRPNLMVDPSAKEDPEPVDEEYADYQVPDDLVW